MSVVTAMEEAGPCRLKLTIEVPAPAVEAEYGRVLREYRKHIQLPGFRPGKVPERVVRKRFGEQLRSEVADRLMPRYWQQAQAEKSIDAMIQPTLENLELQEGEPMIMDLVVETRPEITLGDIETFDLPEESTEPTESDLDDALADVRRNFGRWETVDRPAAQGDLVIGTSRDLDAHAEDEDAGDDEADADADDAERPVHIEIGGQNVPEELSLELTGKSAGAVVVHTSRHGEGEDAHEHRIEITVTEVKEQHLPDLDDDFAEMVGLDSLDALREVLQQRIAAQKEEDLRKRRTEGLLRQLRDRHPVTLPEGVVQQESESILREQAEQMARQGVDLDKAGINWDGMFEQIRPMAERRVHERLVLDAIAKEQDIRLDEERFERFLAAAAADQGASSHALRQRLSEDGRLESLRAQLLRNQTVAQLLGEEPDALDDDAAMDAGADEAADADDPYALSDDDDPYDLADDAEE